MPADGGSVAVTVSAARDCTWTATSDAPWMQLSATSGQGNGSFSVTVGRNDLPSVRSGGVSVNSVRVTVSQEARPCAFDLRGSDDRMSSGGGRGSIEVIALSGCAWTATTSASWIRILTPSGTGAGNVQYEVSPNPGSSRDATITVGDRQYTVVQAANDGSAAPLPPNCSPTLSAQTIELPQAGGNAPVAVTINGACDWTAASGPSDTWLSVAPATGRGNGSVTVSADRNDGATRTATVTIAQQTVTVTQPGSCLVTIAPPNATYDQAGGSGVITVETAPGCGWTASSNQRFASVTRSSGNGSGEARYTVSANTSASTRNAIISIGNRQHTITQRGCTFSVSPGTATVPARGGGGTVRVNTEGSCPWTVSGSVTGMEVEPRSGTGSGTFSYTVPENTGTANRTITLRVGGQTHVITQEGAAPPPPACTVSVEPASSAAIAAQGGTSTFNVVTGPTCQWSASAGGFATITNGAGGTGPGSVSYSVPVNGDTSARTAAIVVTSGSASATHTVNQQGATPQPPPPPPPQCTYSIAPREREVDAIGAVGVVQVTTGATCAWTATTSESWIRLSKEGDTGPDGVGYLIEPNEASTDRVGTATIAGQTFTVRQRRRTSGPGNL